MPGTEDFAELLTRLRMMDAALAELREKHMALEHRLFSVPEQSVPEEKAEMPAKEN